MDQGDAAVWAAGLGIAGTLIGALSGALIAARSTRQQVKDQEAVDLRHRLRDERRAAFAAVLDRHEDVRVALDRVILSEILPERRASTDRREVWGPLNTALNAMQRAVMNVLVTGPNSMAQAAEAMHTAAVQQANTYRMPEMAADERAIRFAETTESLEEARNQFIDGAQKLTGAPE